MMLTNLYKLRSLAFGANRFKKLVFFGALLLFGFNGFGQIVTITSNSNPTEGQSALGDNFIVHVTGLFNPTISVKYRVLETSEAVEGDDFIALSGEVIVPFNILGSSAPIQIDVFDDDLVEGNESIIIELLENPGNYTIGSQSSAVITIQDNDASVAFSTENSSGLEDTGDNLPTLIVNGGVVDANSNITIIVDPSSTALLDEDYFLTTTINIPPGTYNNQSVPIDFSIIPDAIVEPDETIVMELGTLTGDIVELVSPSTTTYTILNDDSVTVAFSSAADSDQEDVGANLPTLFVTGTVFSPTTVTVTDLGTGTAANGTDYTFESPQVVEIPAGIYDGTASTELLIPTLAITSDGIVEPDETIILELGTATGDATLGATILTTYTILNDDSNVISIVEDETFFEGNTGTTAFDFSATRTGDTSLGASATFTVTPSGANPVNTADFVGNAFPTGAVNFAAGSDTATFTVTVNGDFIEELDEIFTVTLSDPSLGYTIGTANAIGTIRNDDTAGVTVSAISGNTTENGGTATFTMVLNSQPTANVTIPISSSNPNEGRLDVTSVMFSPSNWNVIQTITVTGVDDSVVDGNIPYTIITGKPSSTDPIYNALNAGDIDDVVVINEDNDNCMAQPVQVPGIPTTFCNNELSQEGVGQDLNEYVAASDIPTGFVLIWSRSSNFNSMGARVDGSLVFDAGTYYGFLSSGTCTSIPLAVNLTRSTPPSITNTTPDTICGPGTATLTATGSAAGGSIFWYTSETATNSVWQGLSFSTPNIEATTVYYVEVFANGCTSERVPVTVTVLDPIILGTTEDNITACNKTGEDNTTVDLDDTRIGNGLVTGVWSIVGTPPGTVTIDANNIVDFENAAEGEYVFRFTADTTGFPCVEDNMNPSVDVTIGVSACTTESEMDLSLEKAVDNANVSEGDEVIFTITLTNLSPILVTNIAINELIDPNLGFQYVSHSTSKGVYDVVRGVWNLDEVLEFEENTLTITAIVLREGSFQNVAALVDSFPVDADSTNNTARVSVTVGPRLYDECGFMFNQISPNGDGTNDALYINCIDQYPNNSIQIYDRYGNEVFAARRYDNSWMGTGKNGNLPKGTYFYILDLGDGTEVRKGWIQIIR